MTDSFLDVFPINGILFLSEILPQQQFPGYLETI